MWKTVRGMGGSGGNIVHVKGNWRIRVKGQTGRERERNIIKAEQLFKKGQEWRRKEKERVCLRKCAWEREREIAGRLGTVFLGIKDLLSGERAEAKRGRESRLEKMDKCDHFKRPECKHFCPCHFKLGLVSMSQSRRCRENEQANNTQMHIEADISVGFLIPVLKPVNE